MPTSSETETGRRLRVERETGDRARDVASRRRRRLQLVGATVLAAAAIVAVAIVAGSGGSSTSKLKAGQAPPGSAQVAARFAAIPQHGTVLGNPRAPVTLVEFTDLKCPVCRDYTLSAFPTLVGRYVRTGKVRMVMELQDFVGNRDGDSERAARMALAAARQNKLWQFADLFYINQRDEGSTYVNDVFLRTIASGVRGLDVNRAFAARNSGTVSAELDKASSAFNTAGFTGTPSFAVGRTGGTLTAINHNSLDVSQFSGPIDRLLAS
jgi:protein-disulfide isomerase